MNEIKLLKAFKMGFSIIEIIMVVGIFAVIGILVARTVIFTIRGTNKSEASIVVRENVDYAMNVMQRQLEGAKTVGRVDASVGINRPCDGTARSIIDYQDGSDNWSTFSFEPAATSEDWRRW